MKKACSVLAGLIVSLVAALPASAGGQASPPLALDRAAGSQLIGQPVFLRDGEQLGWLEQILVDPETDAVSFVALSIAAEEEGRLVPWDAFSVEEDGRVVLVVEDVLAEAPFIIGAPLRLSPESEELATQPPGEYADMSMLAFSYAPFDPLLTVEGVAVGVIRGVIVQMESVTVGDEPRLLLLVDVGPANVPVDLGNADRLEALGVEFTPGDPIRLTGSKTVRNGEVVVQAAQVMIGSRIVNLRR